MLKFSHLLPIYKMRVIFGKGEALMNFASGSYIGSHQPPKSYMPNYMPKNDGNTVPTADFGYTLSDERKKEMTLDQYKKYIQDIISRMPVHPTQSGRTWLFDISDEGYEAMKNDPEYEKYVLDTIRSTFSSFDSSRSKGVSVFHFGATKEEQRIENWDPDKDDIFVSDDSTEDWWEKRMRLMSENLKHMVIMAQKRQKERSEFEKGMIFAERLNTTDRQKEFLEEGKNSNHSTDKNSIRSRAAISAYRMSLIMKNSDII